MDASASNDFMDLNWNLQASFWMSFMVESARLPVASSTDMLTDWTIIAHPPITLQNSLRLPATFLIWERSAAGLFVTPGCV